MPKLSALAPKTPRTRRKQGSYASKSRNDVDDNFKEKENWSHNATCGNPTSTVAEKQESRPQQNEASTQTLLRDMLSKCQPDISKVDGFWNDDTKLFKCIAEASISEDKPTMALHLSLDEKSSRLLVGSRRLIKQATSIQKGGYAKKQSSSLFGCLFVACHALRSIRPRSNGNMENMKDNETAIRLLHHLIQIAADVIKTGSSDLRLLAILISSYDAMNYFVRRYRCQFSNKDLVVRFENVERERIMVPKWNFTEVKGVLGTLTLRQVSSIYIKAIQALTIGINHLWHASAKHQTKIWYELRRLAPLCGRFCTAIVATLENSHDSPSSQQQAVERLRHAYMSWVLCLLDSREEECLKDALLHCKVGHSILWDVASKIKSSHLSETQKNHASLNMRMNATLLMLPLTDTQNEVALSNFDSACCYAWKAASVYVQSVGSTGGDCESESPLTRYHHHIGKVLDCIVLSMPRPRLSLSYIEYSAHRMLHASIVPPVDLLDESKSDGSFFDAFLAVILLVASVRNQLEGVEETSDLVFYFEEKIPALGMTIVEGVKTLEPEESSRSAKLLTMFSLHRSLYIASRRERHLRDEQSLRLAGIIATKCVAPFLATLLEKAPEISNSTQLVETIAECYIRSISAFDKLGDECFQQQNPESGSNYTTMCDEMIEDLHRFVNRIQDRWPSSSLLAKCAKSVSIVGRQRAENYRNGASIFPIVHSITLYNNAATEYEHSEYQLSTRLNHLATVYQNLGRLEESSLALAAIIVTEFTLNNNANTNTPELDCVDLLASKTKSVLSPMQGSNGLSALLKSTIKRLVSIFPSSVMQSRKKMTSTASCLDLNSILGMLLENAKNEVPVFQMLARHLGGQVCLKCLLGALLQPQKANTKEMLAFHLPTSVEFIIQLGGHVSQMTATDHTELILSRLSDHNDFVAYAEMVIVQHLSAAPVVKSTLVSLLNLVASTSLLSVRNFAEDTVHGTLFEVPNDAVMKSILHLASESLLGIQAVNASQREDGWDSIIEAIGLAGSQFSLFLKLAESPEESPTSDMMKHFRLCEDIAATALRRKSVRPETKKWILWNLLNMKSRLDIEGDCIGAAKLAWLASALADKSEIAEMEWLAAIFIESYLRVPLLQRRIALSVNSEVYTNGSSTNYGSLGELASLAAHLSLLMLDERSDEPIDRYKITGLLESESVLSLWVLSSLSMAQARFSHRSGSLVMALKQIQICITHCQRILTKRRQHSQVKNGDLPFWFRAARMCLFVQAYQRYADCLFTKSKLFIQLGDHRKAWSCVLSVPRVLGADIETPQTNDRTLTLKNTILSLISSKSLILRRFHRFRLAVNCLLSPSDLVVSQFKCISPEKLVSGQAEFIEESIQDLIAAGDVLHASEMATLQRSDFKDYYECLSRHQLSPLPITYSSLRLPMNLATTESSSYSSKLRLVKARCLVENVSEMGEEMFDRVDGLCRDVVNDSTSSSMDEAWANYYIGLIALESSRRNGDLARLWQDEGTIATELLVLARQSFLSALSRIDSCDNTVFYRTLVRSLALVSGPENGGFSGAVAGILVLTSIGSTGRRQMVKSLSGKEGAEDFVRAFSCFDIRPGGDSGRDCAIHDFLGALEAVIPKNWHFVAAVICPTGELLLTSLGKEGSESSLQVKTRCIFPAEEKHSAYEDILRPLDEIIGRSQQHLQGMDSDQVRANYTKEAAKRDWWSVRNQLDEALSHHIHQVEENYFSTIHYELNSTVSIFEEQDTERLPCGNLASRFEAACDPVSMEVKDSIDREELLWKLTVPKLKEKLRPHNYSDSQMRRMRKHEIIEKILEFQEQKKKEKVETASRDGGTRGCLFLLLDENLQRFPFEGMESLEGKPVFRIPSLPFVYATLRGRIDSDMQGIGLDPFNATFVLDPESNLESTRKRLLPVLEEVSSSRQWDWDGVVGRPPTSSFFKNALIKENGLVIFIGHGGAQTCYSRREVEQMISGEGSESFRTCRASLILMGCSSGRLVSVNQKGSNSLEEQPLFFDPEGIALSYLCAGSPCVVGNLWDVTDHDIDRFSIALFQKFFGESDTEKAISLGDCVATSRSSCKLRYIVGCAPVCYGIPVFCR